MCRYIYISEEISNSEVKHERICGNDGHELHRDEYIDGAWVIAEGKTW